MDSRGCLQIVTRVTAIGSLTDTMSPGSLVVSRDMSAMRRWLMMRSRRHHDVESDRLAFALCDDLHLRDYLRATKHLGPRTPGMAVELRCGDRRRHRGIDPNTGLLFRMTTDIVTQADSPFAAVNYEEHYVITLSSLWSAA